MAKKRSEYEQWLANQTASVTPAGRKALAAAKAKEGKR